MGRISNLDLVPELPTGAPNQAEAAPSVFGCTKNTPFSLSNQGFGTILFCLPLHAFPQSPLQSQP